jgi:outer membrane lipoprotein-sorting protein
LLFLTFGCGKVDIDKAKNDFQNKVTKSKSYLLKGNMEIINNDDTYEYLVEVSFLKDDYYKVRLVNQTNNHEQIILKNTDGVYVKNHKSTKQKLSVI